MPVVALYIYRLVPEFLLRFVAWLLIHFVYRLERRGIENVPASGPALLICNHVGFADAIVISAACPDRSASSWRAAFSAFPCSARCFAA